jgi:DNA-binding transcriptional regulator YiaG
MEEKMSDFVRQLRHQLGMTQEEFAHALGITVGTVNRWENRRFRPSKLARATIMEFARRHGVPMTASERDVGMVHDKVKAAS